MAKRKTKAERAIEAELQLEAEHLNHTEDTMPCDSVSIEEEPLHVEDREVQHTYIRRLRKL